jgi:hypothetical protein
MWIWSYANGRYQNHRIEFDPVRGGSGCGLSETLEPFWSNQELDWVLGGSGCGLIMYFEAFESNLTLDWVLGGSGCGLIMYLEPLESNRTFLSVLGGSGCGLIMTFEPGFEFLPPTMMIDRSSLFWLFFRDAAPAATEAKVIMATPRAAVTTLVIEPFFTWVSIGLHWRETRGLMPTILDQIGEAFLLFPLPAEKDQSVN